MLNPSLAAYQNLDQKARVDLMLLGCRQTTSNEASGLERKLESDPDDFFTRVRLLHYYRILRLSPGLERSAHFRHVIWIVDNFPAFDCPLIASSLSFVGVTSPRDFGIARDHWLAQVELHPADSKVLGNAGSFIGFTDVDTGLDLLEKAHSYDPDDRSWLMNIVCFCWSEASSTLLKYKAGYAKRALEYGDKLLQTEECGSELLTLGQMADCALILADHDCGTKLANDMMRRSADAPLFRQIANAYRGLIELANDNVQGAVDYLLVHEKEYEFVNPTVWRLAEALCARDQGKSVIEWIRKFGPSRYEFIPQIEAGIVPNFSKGASIRNAYVANAEQGLDALEKNDLDFAGRLLLKKEPGHRTVINSEIKRLAHQLCLRGKGEVVIKWIRGTEGISWFDRRKSEWISDIQKGNAPDFD